MNLATDMAFSTMSQSSKRKRMDPDAVFCPVDTSADITLLDSALSILAYSFRYKISKAQTEDLLRLIKLHLKPDNVLPNSYDRLREILIQSACGTGKDYIYCSKCEKTILVEHIDSVTACPSTKCQGVDQDVNKFRLLSVTPQLRKIIEDNWCKIVEFRRKTVEEASSDFRDICDGSVYKNMRLTSPESTITLGLMSNTDGLPVFRSTNCSLWPVMLNVADIPGKARHLLKNTAVAGLWFGPSKPNVKVFFNQLLEDFKEMTTTGIAISTPSGTSTNILLEPLMMIADLPARALVMNMKLFNGKFGCPTCFHPGMFEGGASRYPPIDNIENRTAVDFTNHALAAQKLAANTKKKSQDTSVYGVKGISPLLQFMDFPQAVPWDYMHSVLEGVVKRQLMKLWFDSKMSEEFSLKKQQEHLNNDLHAISVPHDMHRKPGGLKEYKSWKASEVRDWLLFISLPILKDYLPGDFYAHYCLLSTAMYLMLKPVITELEVDMAHEMLCVFYSEMGSLYGDTEYSINTHSLNHLADQIKMYGPLWTHSSFPYEAKLSQLKDHIHGSRSVISQVMTSISLQKEVEETSNLAVSERVSQFVHSMQGLNNRNDTGTCINGKAAADVKSSVMTPDGKQVYGRMTYKGETFHGEIYGRKGTTNSYTVGFKQKDGIGYGKVKHFEKNGRKVHVEVEEFETKSYTPCRGAAVNNAKLLEFVENGWVGRQYIAIGDVRRTLTVEAHDILFKCVSIQNKDKERFVVPYFPEIGIY